MTFRTLTTYCAVAIFVATSAACAAEPTKEDLAFFENRIRPLLVEHCQKCHGAKKQESGLRLDHREMMLAGGDRGAAIDLADAGASLLLKAVQHEGDLKMPEKKLPQPAIADLAEWIRRGAPWPAEAKTATTLRSGPITKEERQFWSLQPPQDLPLPEVKDASRISTPIDRFINAAWEKNGLTPSPLADKRTLLRRATFDLTGLPPELEDVNAFLADESPDAFAKTTDRLLASPAYGERWGRHWLDVVRYADTAGETADYPVREAYRYRNYVIESLNRDKPYDQFVREQIAGDILARTAPREKYAELVTATGYLAISRRFGFDSENYHHLTIQDTIDTLGQSFLALTLGCARCHDHKFDPVTTSDYYALYGIFESSRYAFPGSEQKQKVRAMAPLLPPEEAAAAWRKYDERFTVLAKQLETAKQGVPSVKVRSLDDIDGDFELQGVSAGGSRGVLVLPWTYAGEPLITNGAQSSLKNIYRGGGVGAMLPGGDGEHSISQAIPAYLAKDAKSLHVTFDFRMAPAHAGSKGEYRFCVGNGANIPAAEIFISSEAAFVRGGDEVKEVRKLKPGQWYQAQLNLDIAAGTWQASIAAPEDPFTSEPLKLAGGFRGDVNHLAFDARGHLPGPRPMLEIDNIAASRVPFPSVDSPLPTLPMPEGEVKLPEIQAELHSLLEIGPSELAYAVVEGTPVNTRIHKRGEPSKLGDEVPRRWLDVLGGDVLANDNAGSGRLELANWLTRKDNPLTARVMVNRIWQHHFAQGLVATENDFGTRGSRPTHPELLDYLASRLQADGWSIKKLHRRMMLSGVYQLSSAEPASTNDLVNVFLSHYPRQRLDAESLRDSLLLLGGNLDRSVGKEQPFPALATWGFTQHNPFTAVYDSPRRSIYLMTQRLKRHPYLSLFDGADTNASTPRRQDTTVPTQSLFLLNDPFVHEQAAGLARRIIASSTDEPARIRRAYEIILTREPTADDLAAEQTFLAEYRKILSISNIPADQRDVAAWSALVRTVLTRNDFLFVD
ncbi:MAG: PSD1 domain-containing protein [Pirellulaceae bacterium]|nr:PSD1 domain-containing protein [Pirellulaceae bacterium]